MHNPRLQSHNRCNLLLVILLAGLAWLIYDNLKPSPIETMLADRMRCTYNYRDAKLVKRQYSNGITYYECAPQ